MSPKTKNLVKAISPPVLVSAAKWLRQRLETPSPSFIALQKDFEQRNRDVEPGTMMVREGILLKPFSTSRVSFEYFCFRSTESVEELDLFLKLSKNKKNLLDIGALHGIFSLTFTATDPSKNSLAVDPSPVAFSTLLYNVYKNAPDQVIAMEFALSDSEGSLDMHFEWEHAVAAGDPGDSETIKVQKITGEQLCRDAQFEPDVVKIDVEGHEVKVIRGLASVIERLRPMIFLEIHPARIRAENDSINELLRFFESLRYEAIGSDEQLLSFAEISANEADLRLVLRPITNN